MSSREVGWNNYFFGTRYNYAWAPGCGVMGNDVRLYKEGYSTLLSLKRAFLFVVEWRQNRRIIAQVLACKHRRISGCRFSLRSQATQVFAPEKKYQFQCIETLKYFRLDGRTQWKMSAPNVGYFSNNHFKVLIFRDVLRARSWFYRRPMESLQLKQNETAKSTNLGENAGKVKSVFSIYC